MRILCVSSQVVFGPVGNSAAVPALQAAGHEVLSIPTVTLSNHPGHGKPAGFRTSPEDLRQIFGALTALGTLEDVDAVLTGYFASQEQVEITANVLSAMRKKKPDLYVLVDPVLGDDGKLYVPGSVAESIRDLLLPLATCITPNRFELSWLSGLDVHDADTALRAARALGQAEIIATSIPASGNQLSTHLVTPKLHKAHVGPKLASVPNGTGDFLSGLYLAHRVSKTAPEAFAAAMATLGRAIAMSAGTRVLDVAGALHAP